LPQIPLCFRPLSCASSRILLLRTLLSCGTFRSLTLPPAALFVLANTVRPALLFPPPLHGVELSFPEVIQISLSICMFRLRTAFFPFLSLGSISCMAHFFSLEPVTCSTSPPPPPNPYLLTVPLHHLSREVLDLFLFFSPCP